MTTPPHDDSPATEADAPVAGPPERVRASPRTGGWLGFVVVVAGIALVLALFAVTLAGRVDRSPAVPLVAAVTLLPYLYAATLALLFAIWSALPDRRVVPAAIGAVTLVAASLWGLALPATPDPEAGDPLRVVSWNVRRLWGGPSDGDDPTRCVVDALRTIEADVLSLQEVTARDVAALERALGISCVQSDYLGTGDPTAGGVAACVAPGRWSWRSGTHARFVPDRAWRYAFLEVEREGRVVNLLAVHLEPYRLAAGGLQHADDVGATQGDQSAELLRRVTRFRDPTIVAGDFNSTRDAALHVALRGLMDDAFERGGRGFGPSFFLFDRIPVRIDHVYVTGEIGIREASVPPLGCSDHRPIVADLTLRAAP